MKIVLSAMLVLVSTMIACTNSKEEVPVATTSTVSSTPVLVTPTDVPTPGPTPSPSSPETTATPAPHFVDPSEQDFQDAHQIYQALPKPLPDNESYRIEWIGEPGIFSVVVIAQPASDEEYKQIVEEALGWFVTNGFDPCAAPLAAVLAFVGNQPPRQTPPPYEVWEPSDFCK